MAWTVCVCVSVVLLALCGKQQAAYQGNQLSPTGFHLCTRNQSRNVSFLVVHVVSQTVTKSCGGWLPLTTCTVTVSKMVHQTEYKTVTKLVTECCDGYVQAGVYCVLSVNRSREFTTKPGSCPPAQGWTDSSQECELDVNCPGWQRCCQMQERFVCTDPTSITSTSEKGDIGLNATVTVKTEYQQLVSEEESLLNHLRLLHSMVSGAMQAESVIYYLSSWPVHPHRTATSLLIHHSPPLSVQHVTARLHLLLTHIDEVSDVTVQDIDECAHTALNPCSSPADCNNTMGSYQCVCPQGYLDVDPENPGANCSANVNVWTTTERLSTIHSSMSAYTDSPSSQGPEGSITMGVLSTTGSNMTTALSNTSSALYNSSDASLWTTPHSSMSSSVEPPEPTSSCAPPSISSLWAENVTETSFSVCWISQSVEKQTFQVVVSNRSEVVFSVKTNQSWMEVTGLKLGLLYNVSVTPSACGNQGIPFDISVKTDAETVDVSARFTNIQFTEDLQDPNSPAYKDLSQGIIDEIYSSLSQDMKAMMDSGQVTIVITGFSSGSLVVNFNLIYHLNQSQDISDVSTVLLESLIDSKKYLVDEKSTRVNDFDECESGDNDCSQEATCNNTWASYTCECLGGFMDKTPERPGRVCQAITTTTTTTKTTQTTTTSSGVGTTTTAAAAATSMDSTTTKIAVLPLVTSDSRSTTISTSMIATPQASPHTGTSTSAPTITGTPTTSPPTTTGTPTISPSTTTSIATTGDITTTGTTANIAMATTGTITTSPPTTTGIITTNATTTNGTIITSPPTTTGITTISGTTTNGTITTSPPTTTGIITTSATTTNGTITPSPQTNTGKITASTSTTTGIITIPPTTTSTTTTTTTSPPTTTGTTITGSTTSSPSTTPGTATTSTPTTTGTTTATSSPTTTGTTTSSALTTTATSTTMSPLKTPVMPKTLITSPIKTTTTTSTNPPPVPSTTSLRLMLGDVSVECRDAAITVTVARSFLVRANIQESALYLGLPECGVKVGNDSHVQLTVGSDGCTTTLEQNEISYTASVYLYMESNTANEKVVVPKANLAKFAVPIMCTFMKKIIVSADHASMGYTVIEENITGFGSFQVIVQLMNGTMPLPQNYSLSSKEAVVLEVRLNTSSELIKLVIDKCWVTASRNSLDPNSYTFLKNSCAMNVFTNVLMNGNSSTSRVSVQIFSFVSLDVIYLHCQVQICLQTGSDTCLADCGQRAAHSGKIIGRTFGSLGPIFKEDEELLEETLDLAHVVGFSCLGAGLMILFIVGFVCLFYYQRNRIGHYNFSNKPKRENFTYLVYD